ncbi:MAG: DMT family transporter [Bacteroidaceae bacterium]|nr:DMT family transporter [Bacteroidaceae bacterium]
MSTKQNILAGHIALIFCNIAWGVMSPFSKDVMNLGLISPWLLAGTRVIAGTAVFWLLYLLVPQQWLKHEKVAAKDMLQLFFASMLVITLSTSLNIIGTNYTSPIEATVVCSTTPILTLIFSVLLIHERLSWLRALGVVLGFSGALAFIFDGKADLSTHATNPMLGNTLCFVSQICGALYLVLFGKVLSKYSAFTSMMWMFTFSTVIMLPVVGREMVTADWAAMPLRGWLDIAFIVLVCSVICYILLPIGQKTVRPTAVAMYNYIRPIASAVLSALMGLAVVDWHTALYTLFIFAGVWLVNAKR